MKILNYETPLMREIHTPSRRQAQIFFFGAILLAVGISLWMIFFNKGNLAVDGDIPFTVQVGSVRKTCEERPCVIPLKPKKYRLALTKEGFYPDEREISVKRGENTAVTVSFRFIPVLREIGNKKSLENFPRDAKDVSFAASGDRAILRLGKEFYLYVVSTKKLSELNFAVEMAPAWLGEEIIYLETANGKHLLKQWNDGKPSVFTTFERAFNAPRLQGSPNEKYILITDGERGNFYLFDVLKKSRKKLEVADDAMNPALQNFSIIIEEGGDKKKISAISLDTLSRTTLNAIDSKNVNEFAPGKFMFFSREKGEAESFGKGALITFSEVLGETKKDNAEFTMKTNLIYLMEYRAADGSSEIIAEVHVNDGETVARLARDPSGKKWFFEKGGKVFEVVLEKE